MVITIYFSIHQLIKTVISTCVLDIFFSYFVPVFALAKGSFFWYEYFSL
uniref:Uncharacterized protein n=1 Tax=Parascaris equorum TaxID=6256 RepID=A0A914RTE7_PAREQ